MRISERLRERFCIFLVSAEEGSDCVLTSDFADCMKFSVCRYEGTYEINTLVAGRGATGIAAFKAAPSRTKSVGSAEGVH
jgi:hypothetical protein